MHGNTKHAVHLARNLQLVALLVAAHALLGCGDEATDGPVLRAVTELPERASAGQPLDEPVTVVLESADGAAIADASVTFVVEGGGGAVSQESVTTNAEGTASTEWTLGIVPVDNVLTISADGQTLSLTVRADLAEPMTPEPFSDVDGFLESEGLDGSTEDLAFSADGRLIMSIDGGLIAVSADGSIESIELTGDPLIDPLGIAFDRAGNLWVADSDGSALRRVSPDGVVTTHLDDTAEPPLVAPNYVAIDHMDRVFVSDACGGAVIGFDPATDEPFTRHEFDYLTEGGPNGMAFDAAGTTLYVSTENTSFFCDHSDVSLTAPISGLFRIDTTDGSLGERSAIVTDFAIFGDGIAVDIDGNIYVNFIFEEDIAIEKSTTWVLPAGDTELVELLLVNDRVMANLAFAPDAFGEGMLYIAALAVPPFTSLSTRGLLRVDVGLDGLPLLP